MQREIRELFVLMESTQNSLYPFRTPTCFSNYAEVVRKENVLRDGWKSSIIKIEHYTADNGVFRDGTHVLQTALRSAGVVGSVRAWNAKYRENERVWSSVIDSDSLGSQVVHYEKDMTVIAAGIYTDRTTLSSSGSQSTSVVRLHFSNISGIYDR